MKLGDILAPYTEINSQLIKDLNLRPDTYLFINKLNLIHMHIELQQNGYYKVDYNLKLIYEQAIFKNTT